VREGIYGGSFDPVHKGHIAAAAEVRRRRDLARVHLVPAARPPHKPPCGAPFPDRVAMARLAIAGQPGLAVLDAEGRRPGESFTIDTVEELRRSRPGLELELLVGADMLADLPGWRRARELVAGVRVVAFGRPGTDADAARAVFEKAFGPEAYVWLDLEPLAVSSSEIRRRIAAGEPVTGLLDPAVEAYIFDRGLYTDGG